MLVRGIYDPLQILHLMEIHAWMTGYRKPRTARVEVLHMVSKLDCLMAFHCYNFTTYRRVMRN
jgi:hypothetical protein